MRHRRRLEVGIPAAALVVAWLTPCPAGTPTARRVSLVVDPCVPTQEDAVRRVVALELGTELAPTSEPDVTTVRVSCEGGSQRLEVGVAGGAAISRTIDLEAELPVARSRLLALAIVELVTAGGAEPERDPAQPETPTPAPPTPAPPPATPTPPALAGPALAPERTRDGYRLEALVAARLLLATGLASLGGGARLSRPLGRAWGWSLDVLADHGDASTPLGSVTVDTLSVGPSLFLQKAWRRFSVQGGAGLRLGLARFSGDPTPGGVSGHALASPWGGPFADGRATVEVAHGFAVDVGGEAGETPFPARGLVSGNEPVSFVGVWLGAHVAGVFRF